MGLENVTGIWDFNQLNPTKDDKRRQGDDHLRNIKKAILATFPNINAVVNASDEELNFLVGVTSEIQAQLDEKLTSADIDLTPYAQLAVRQAWTKTQQITPVDHGNQSGSRILNCANSDSHIVRAIGNLTLSLSNLQEGQSFFLKLIQGTSGPAAVVTLPSAMKFSFGAAPDLTTTLNAYDAIAGKYIEGELICGFLPEVG